jgi:uncharacterized protein YhfF|tara:strand:- start:139 stop:699 length:561 start_codon:yes stop_codon:yes gene_type:complete
MNSNLIKIFTLIVLTLTSCKNDSKKNDESEMKINKQSVENLWSDFIQENPENKNKKTPISFYFCDNKKDADECAELVVKGIKRATATSLWWFEKNNEILPKIGDQYIVTDWDGNAKAVIETIKIEQVPYNKITSEFAEIEGEGDKSLEYWKRVHKDYYTREMEPYNEQFDENMIIVCEQFKTIYLK